MAISSSKGKTILPHLPNFKLLKVLGNVKYYLPRILEATREPEQGGKDRLKMHFEEETSSSALSCICEHLFLVFLQIDSGKSD